MLELKLYLDEDTHSYALINALTARGIDVLSTGEANRSRTPDNEQLLYATSQNRVIFTFNVKDFVLLHHGFLTEGWEHAGIIVSQQLPTGVVLRRLLKLIDAKSQTDMKNWLEFLGNWR